MRKPFCPLQTKSPDGISLEGYRKRENQRCRKQNKELGSISAEAKLELKLNQGISSLQTRLEKTLLTLSKLYYQQQYEVGGTP